MSYLSEDGVAGVAEEENEIVQAGAVDPLAEADVYLAYEQAVQVLKEAYSTNPERSELAEKLLEIYHKQDDRIAFDNLATELQARLGAKQNPIWDKVCAMGREVSPDNEMYLGSVELPDLQDLDESPALETMPDQPGLSIPPAEQIEVLDLDEEELDLAAGATPTAEDVEQPLELDDLELSLEEEGPADRAIDAPTLSQIISAAEAEEQAQKLEASRATAGAEVEGDDDGGEIEFNLGDIDEDEDFQLDIDESTELANALRDAEIEQADDEPVEEPAEEPVEEPVAERIEEPVVELIEEPAEEFIEEHAEEPSEPVSEPSLGLDTQSKDDSYLSELSEQSISKLEPYHESETALELAKAYLELGEKDIAKGFIEEVINEGNPKQKARAEKLVKDLVD